MANFTYMIRSDSPNAGNRLPLCLQPRTGDHLYLDFAIYPIGAGPLGKMSMNYLLSRVPTFYYIS